ncbi:hypothetical protein Mgra_00009430 [Meloidogyne graminicola]|uniref:Uncharacterized protein n=1 Tax=Meloidogyne graminicola TaxID=189291 RepID=A0A8S9Z7S5_9BILA|nr:hypothetical protein Mgra_00009430 [Meloidogyne graminicola]
MKENIVFQIYSQRDQIIGHTICNIITSQIPSQNGEKVYLDKNHDEAFFTFISSSNGNVKAINNNLYHYIIYILLLIIKFFILIILKKNVLKLIKDNFIKYIDKRKVILLCNK